MRKIKNTIRILVFAALLCGLLGVSGKVLEQKDSENGLRPFLDSAEEYDVLFFGDSLVRYGVFPLELYHKYGIASYNLGSSNALIPMSYWRLVNALDYAAPKVVMMSVVEAEEESRITILGERLHVLLGAFPMTLNKARAILDLTESDGEDENGVAFSDIRRELFFPLRKYHSRWSDLTNEDFEPVLNAQKGAVPRVHVSDAGNALRPEGVYEPMPEKGDGYAYLRRIIETCRERDIQLVLYHPPGPLKEKKYKSLLRAEKIAEEYGVPMINFTDMDHVIDAHVDCADTGGHLNCSGVLKVTDYIGRYLADHYSLPDRRQDAAYAHWDEQWDAYVDEKIRMIREEADSLRSRLALLHDDSFHVVLTVRPGFDYESDYIKEALQNIARQHLYENDESVAENWNPLVSLDDAADFNQGYMLIVDRDAQQEYEAVQEFYGIGEQEFETSFGYVFCRMDGEWIDLSLTQADEEIYYFDSWEEQEEDMRLILIDRRTGKPALAMAFSCEAAE